MKYDINVQHKKRWASPTGPGYTGADSQCPKEHKSDELKNPGVRCLDCQMANCRYDELE